MSAAHNADDVLASARETASQVEKLLVSYRRGTKAHDLASSSTKALTETAAHCQRGTEALDSLGNSSEVMRSHAQSAAAASTQVKQVAKVLGESHRTLMHGWSLCIGAREGHYHDGRYSSE